MECTCALMLSVDPHVYSMRRLHMTMWSENNTKDEQLPNVVKEETTQLKARRCSSPCRCTSPPLPARPWCYATELNVALLFVSYSTETPRGPWRRLLPRRCSSRWVKRRTAARQLLDGSSPLPLTPFFAADFSPSYTFALSRARIISDFIVHYHNK